jgi:hypothetical protein
MNIVTFSLGGVVIPRPPVEVVVGWIVGGGAVTPPPPPVDVNVVGWW